MTGTETEMRFEGIPLSSGVACARAYIMESSRAEGVLKYSIDKEDTDRECARLQRAIDVAKDHLDHIVQDVTERLGAAQANIFAAQKMMLEDPVLMEQLVDGVNQDLMNAEAVVEQVLLEYEERFLALDNEYMKERVSDISEIRYRLIRQLGTDTGLEQLEGGSGLFSDDELRIVVAKEILPSDTVQLDTNKTLAFISEKGGQASHAAILARALGIPAASGLKGITSRLNHGDLILIDGETGVVIHNPSPGTLNLYPGAKRTSKSKAKRIEVVDKFQVLGNISLSTDCKLLEQSGAEGVGLYRTEFEFFFNGNALSEDEQYERYRYVLEALNGKPLYIRLLDFGGDKPAPFLDLAAEQNSFLGFRGARLLLKRKDLLVPQARALARASVHGEIHVIYPMITDLKQFLMLREMILQNTQDIENTRLKHGVMFEVPSACLDAEEILSVAECGSIGTNDLIQYLFAVDRTNDLVTHDYSPDRPAFWKLIKIVVDAAEKTGRPLSVCGEIGGQPEYIPKLIECGVRCVSVSPRMIGTARLTAKRALGEVTYLPVE